MALKAEQECERQRQAVILLSITKEALTVRSQNSLPTLNVFVVNFLILKIELTFYFQKIKAVFHLFHITFT